MSPRILPIVIGLLTVCFSSISQEARPSQDQEEPVPFKLLHLAYGQDGQLRSGPGIRDGLIQTLYYGNPIENFEYVTQLTLPAESVPNEKDASPSSKRIGPADLPSPQFQFDQWSTKDGLPANKVRAIYETQNGYLGVGTES